MWHPSTWQQGFCILTLVTLVEAAGDAGSEECEALVLLYPKESLFSLCSPSLKPIVGSPEHTAVLLLMFGGKDPTT